MIEESKTSKHWIGCIKIVSIIQNLIKADRLSSHSLHLSSIQEPLPIFSAAGHFNYLKSAYLYLQNMINLKSNNPRGNEIFNNGDFTIKRSTRQWAGLAQDLVIEHTLMRSIKSTGGMTRGGDLSEIQKALWLLSRPITSSYCMQMEEQERVEYRSSDQHSKQMQIGHDLGTKMNIFQTLGLLGLWCSG